MRKPTIVCAGMCNTKGTEIRYLAEQVAERGGVPVIMDLSLGAAVDWADVGLEEVLASTGTRMADVFAAPHFSRDESARAQNEHGEQQHERERRGEQ